MKTAFLVAAGVFLLGVIGLALGVGYGQLSRFDPSFGPAWFPDFALAAGYWGMILLVLSIPAVVVLGLLCLFQIARSDAKKTESALVHREDQARR